MLKKTVKLYEKDVYLKECQSKIIKTIENQDGIYLVLDQSIFFPVGGGQPSDIGTIDDLEVLEVIEKDDVLLHKVKEKTTLTDVTCKLEWSRRLDNMQQHCGEHILSGVILQHYNGVNKGFRMGEDYITIDIDLPEMTQDMIKLIEMESNRAIYRNLPIDISKVETLEEASAYKVRKKITVAEDIRIVTIGDVDCVACCGSHPETTGVVGMIKIIKTENYKGMTRIYFKCGERALLDYTLKHDIVNELCKRYSSEEANLIERIQQEETKFNKLKDAYNGMKKMLIIEEIQKLIKKAENELIYGELNNFDGDDLTLISKHLVESGFTALICTSNGNKVICAHDGKRSLHCGKLFKEHVSNFKGRGGGNDKMAQAVFQTGEDTLAFMLKLKSEIEG